MASGSWEQSLPASCLASAAVMEFSIFLGSWSPHSRAGWAVCDTHSPSAGIKPKPCISILLLSRAVENALATPLNVMGMSPPSWLAGGVAGNVTFLHVICEGETRRGPGQVPNKLHGLLPKPPYIYKYIAFSVRNSGLCSLGFVKGSLASGRDACKGPQTTAGWDHPLPLVLLGAVAVSCGHRGASLQLSVLLWAWHCCLSLPGDGTGSSVSLPLFSMDVAPGAQRAGAAAPSSPSFLP